MAETRILIIRHGQTIWNREQRFRGQTDVPLDETGTWQARVTGETIAARWPLTAVYASPLGRAMQTARAIAGPQGLEVESHPGLLDVDFGAWQGLLASEVEQRWPDLLRAWIEAPQTLHFPGGETLNDVRERSLATLHATVARHAGETVALVAHTVVNRVLLCAAST